MGLAAVVCLYIWVEPRTEASASPDSVPHHITSLIKEHRRALATAGLAVASLQLVRSGRDVALPLWADMHGMTPAQISAMFAAMFLLDMAVFYPAGWTMDRVGRRSVFLASTFVLSVGLGLLSITEGIASITFVALLTGLGNGLGSGINLTLSSDLAPRESRSEFLGLFRLVTDSGVGLGPLVVGASSAVAGLAFALVTTSGIGFIGLALFWLTVPETLVKRAG